MRREPSIWYALLTQKYGAVDESLSECWVNHTTVQSGQEHMLLNCAEAERLREAQRIREVLTGPRRSPDQRPVRETLTRRTSRQDQSLPAGARDRVVHQVPSPNLVRGPARPPAEVIAELDV